MDPFLNLNIGEYIVQEPVGEGCVGKVYKAYREDMKDERAVKFVPMATVEQKPNWQAEITKVNRLNSIEGVVHYHTHGTVDVKGQQYLYIMWEYVQGSSLKEIISQNLLTMQILIDVIFQSFNVFHACRHIQIQHADFHAGNILIEDPNPLYIDESARRVRITDFGYGTFSPTNGVPAMDDFEGLAKIIQECLAALDFHQLEAEDRHKYQVLKYQFPRYLHETNETEGEYVRNPKELKLKLQQLFEMKENVEEGQKNIGDFLAAELIGEQYDEWKALFVPKFLAIEDLLDRNICVLTGLRGCGKTMLFRRLSFDLQEKLGPANIPGENTFIGFYLNARLLAEAFPWLPDHKRDDARKQILNFFNIKWCIEILDWLRGCSKRENSVSVSWLRDYFISYLPDLIFTGTSSDSIIKTIIDGCTKELARSKLGARYMPEETWRFSDYDFLSNFLKAIFQNHGFGAGKSVFFFLDDYSTPMINQTMQQILNPIVFRRISNVYFKVSTESTESFIPTGLYGKTLENGPDYKLVDLGSELFKNGQSMDKTAVIIKAIFEKRINRSSIFSGQNITLEKLLGEPTRSNNELASQIRENDKQVLYHGTNIFCNLWSSDIRELIKILSEMISTFGTDSLKQAMSEESTHPIIPEKLQDSILRDSGGRYLRLLSITTNPNKTIPTSDKTYGSHLMDIVTAFQQMAYFNLKNKNSKNEGAEPPKQARKIELTTISGKWKEDAEDYYKGLIRYGVFIQDYRAKSVRGTAARRLYLRSMLIPYCRITFSKRDSIMMDWDDFNEFLLKPLEYARKYTGKKDSKDHPVAIRDQMELQGL